MRAIVMGGTGLVGLHVLQALSANRVPTVSLARRMDAGVPGVNWRVLESMQIGAADIPPRTTVAFCCLGTTMKKAGSEEAFRLVDEDLVLRFAKACREANVPAFHVISAAGANPKSAIFYNRVKGQVEQQLKELDFTTLAIYRPSLLLGHRKERRPGERVAAGVARLLNPLLPTPLKAVQARVVAQAMIREARQARAGTLVLSNRDIHRLGR